MYESFRTKIFNLAMGRIARSFVLQLVTFSHLVSYLKQFLPNLQIRAKYYIDIFGLSN